MAKQIISKEAIEATDMALREAMQQVIGEGWQNAQDAIERAYSIISKEKTGYLPSEVLLFQVQDRLNSMRSLVNATFQQQCMTDIAVCIEILRCLWLIECRVHPGWN